MNPNIMFNYLADRVEHHLIGYVVKSNILAITSSFCANLPSLAVVNTILLIPHNVNIKKTYRYH